MKLEARDLATAFSYATDWLGVYVEEVNALNVYPVPDGDTGTNMHLTMQSVRRQLHDERPKTMAALAHALSYGSLLGARGNSGVILSQILKGFAESIKGQRTLGAAAVVEALKGSLEQRLRRRHETCRGHHPDGRSGRRRGCGAGCFGRAIGRSPRRPESR